MLVGMHGTASYIDVTDFDREVIAQSATVPVLVDFWAPWCAPCRVLGPVLEALATELAGSFLLAKLDIDKAPDIAARYKVRGIPDVKLFVNGEPVAGFVGAKRAPDVREFLRTHCPSDTDKRVAEADRLADSGDLGAAEAAYQAVLAAAPGHAGAAVGLARVALGLGDAEAVAALCSKVPPAAKERARADALKEAAALLAAALAIGSADEVSARAERDPADIAAAFARGVYRMAQGHSKDALDAFLGVVERDRKWHGEAGRKAMLTTFNLIGVRHPLANEYRKKLMIVS